MDFSMDVFVDFLVNVFFDFTVFDELPRGGLYDSFVGFPNVLFKTFLFTSLWTS